MIIRFWKPILFVALNAFFIAWLAVTLEIFLSVIQGEDPLALLGIMLVDIAFLIAGILLFILNKYYPILLIGRILPFIAILTLTIVIFLNVTAASLWSGVAIAIALIIICVATTLRNLIMGHLYPAAKP